MARRTAFGDSNPSLFNFECYGWCATRGTREFIEEHKFLEMRPNLTRHPCTQGAIHTMSECPNTPKDMAHELRVGVIHCRKQESYYGMSKSKAKDLMQEVCSVLFLLLHLS